MAESKAKAGDYVIVSVAVPYSVDGEPRLAPQGRVIHLDADQATRLLDLQAVREADAEDVAREKQIAEAEEAARNAIPATNTVENPYGGTIVGGATLESHAAQERQRAAEESKDSK